MLWMQERKCSTECRVKGGFWWQIKGHIGMQPLTYHQGCLMLILYSVFYIYFKWMKKSKRRVFRNIELGELEISAHSVFLSLLVCWVEVRYCDSGQHGLPSCSCSPHSPHWLYECSADVGCSTM